MKTIRLLITLVIGLAALAAQAAVALPAPEQVADATAKLQKAGILTAEDAAYFNKNAVPKGKVDAAKIAALINAMAKYKGGASTDYAENLKFLGDKKIMANTKQWETADTKGAVGGSTALLLTTLAKNVK